MDNNDFEQVLSALKQSHGLEYVSVDAISQEKQGIVTYLARLELTHRTMTSGQGKSLRKLITGGLIAGILVICLSMLAIVLIGELTAGIAIGVTGFLTLVFVLFLPLYVFLINNPTPDLCDIYILVGTTVDELVYMTQKSVKFRVLSLDTEQITAPHDIIALSRAGAMPILVDTSNIEDINLNDFSLSLFDNLMEVPV